MARLQSISPAPTTSDPNRMMSVPDLKSATGTRSRLFSHDDVAERAYELFLARGSEDGHDLEDWFEAERLVKTREADQGKLRSAR